MKFNFIKNVVWYVNNTTNGAFCLGIALGSAVTFATLGLYAKVYTKGKCDGFGKAKELIDLYADGYSNGFDAKTSTKEDCPVEANEEPVVTTLEIKTKTKAKK